MSTKFDQIKLLYDCQLHSNVVSLVELILTANNQGNEITGLSKFHTYIYYADSLYQIEEYRKAATVYKNALVQKKTLLKGKGSPKSSDMLKDTMSDTDIKYEMFLCYKKINNLNEAFNVLTSIPGKQRTPKVNMALGQLYQDNGNERSAITCYKEVLKECPIALQAAQGLLSLGVKGVEVHMLILDTSLGIGVNNFGLNWLNTWIRAHAHMYAREYKQAILVFRQLEEKTPFSNNATLLISLAEVYYYYGDYINAKFYLKKAHEIERLTSRGLDIYACILQYEKKIVDLENLIPSSPLLCLNAVSPQMYTAMAYMLYGMKNYSKAALMAQKACVKDPRNVEALILKGNVLLEMKKYKDAIDHFREAMHIASWRFEPHKGLVECYTAMDRHREAVSVACNAYKTIPNSVRATTLYASVLMNDPALDSKALPLVKKALAIDEHHFPAIMLMAEIKQSENIQAAIDILEKQIEHHSSWRLFELLGRYHSKLKEDDKAFTYYCKALNLDPGNRDIIESMNRLETNSANTSSGGVKVEGGVKLEPYFNSNTSDADTTENFNDTMADTSDHEAEMTGEDQEWPSEVLDQNTNRMSRR